MTPENPESPSRIDELTLAKASEYLLLGVTGVRRPVDDLIEHFEAPGAGGWLESALSIVPAASERTPVALLGTSATSDILAGDVNSDGLTDLVFVNTSGVHQTWTATSGGFELHSEQIVDGGALVGVLTELGFTDVDDPGGVDLALGGALQVGTSVYLNDGFGNLGLGDAVPPVLTLVGAASVDVPANSNYVDSGATAEDNIDGDISVSVVMTSNVNTAIVGSYTVTYNVTDFAGNSATSITRTVNVTPAAGAGGGGGGGGAAGPLLLLLLMLAAYLTAWQANRAIIRVGAKKQD